jgi:DNA topoisomerase-6 subunit B
MKEVPIAEKLAKEQRSISISEFFLKNKHLLGFDNPKKALLTTIKEAVDNSLDACEEAKILPQIIVKVEDLGADRFKIVIEDNGPGIIKQQIPNIFGKLLYGSKFHKLKCSRGQQGIGISAAAMYGQLTTGKPIIIISKIQKNKPAHNYELHIDTKKNEPQITKEQIVDWDKDHGTKIKINLEAKYQKGKQGIDEYLKQTAIVNPHLHLIYTNPEKQKLEFPRATKELPKEPKEIKPHPYGVELGILINMLQDTTAKTLQSFLQNDFCRVSAKVAKEISKKAGVYEKSRPSRIAKQEAENLYKAIQEVKIMAPPTDSVTPIGEELLIKGLKKEINADFYASSTRPPSVYRGNPFIIEAGIAYGGDIPKEDHIRLLRFANRVPLQYQQSAGAISKSVLSTVWRNYGLSQSKGSLPIGPIVLIIHIASVWVPFTSESKEAIAHYPEIIKEIKLALQEVGRKLGTHIRKYVRAKEQKQKFDLLKSYSEELADSISSITGEKKDKIFNDLLKGIERVYKDLQKNEIINKDGK